MKNKNISFNVKNISEDELDLILYHYHKKTNYNSNSSIYEVDVVVDNNNNHINNVKEYLEYSKMYSDTLLSPNVLGLLYIIKNKGFTYTRELVKCKNIRWDSHIMALKRIGFIKNISVPEEQKAFMRGNRSVGQYQISKTKCYGLTDKSFKLFEKDNFKTYFNDNVNTIFIDFINEIELEKQFIIDEVERDQDIPDAINRYFNSKHKWNKDRRDKASKYLSEKYKDYIKEHNIKL